MKKRVGKAAAPGQRRVSLLSNPILIPTYTLNDISFTV